MPGPELDLHFSDVDGVAFDIPSPVSSRAPVSARAKGRVRAVAALRRTRQAESDSQFFIPAPEAPVPAEGLRVVHQGAEAARRRPPRASRPVAPSPGSAAALAASVVASPGPTDMDPETEMRLEQMQAQALAEAEAAAAAAPRRPVPRNKVVRGGGPAELRRRPLPRLNHARPASGPSSQGGVGGAGQRRRRGSPAPEPQAQPQRPAKVTARRRQAVNKRRGIRARERFHRQAPTEAAHAWNISTKHCDVTEQLDRPATASFVPAAPSYAPGGRFNLTVLR